MKYFSALVLLFAVFVLFASAQEKSAEEICRQPMERGRCRALLHRFFYNTATEECEKFGYGGCGGNDNNFESKEACEAKCQGIKAA